MNPQNFIEIGKGHLPVFPWNIYQIREINGAPDIFNGVNYSNLVKFFTIHLNII